MRTSDVRSDNHFISILFKAGDIKGKIGHSSEHDMHKTDKFLFTKGLGNGTTKDKVIGKKWTQGLFIVSFPGFRAGLYKVNVAHNSVSSFSSISTHSCCA